MLQLGDLPLTGVTVLDLTRVLAGPYCTRLLADLGARVIKVERPGEGDEMRKNPHQVEPGRDDQSTYFIRINAGKESVAIDLSREGGQAVLRDLARVADVFVENFTPGVVAKLGCDYEAIRAVKPDIVYCSISGFGQSGQWRLRPAFAHIVNAVSGLMYLEQGDDPAPKAANLQAADVLAATHAAIVILAALRRRDRDGRGAYLDVSLLEALVAGDSMTFPSVLNGGQEHGNPRPGLLVYELGGRYFALQAVGAPQLWERLVAVMERPDLLGDSRFATAEARRRHNDGLRTIIGGWVARFPSVDKVLEVLVAARIPCAPVLRPAELIAEPHLEERAFFPLVPHPARPIRVTASPYHVDREPVHPRSGAAYRVGEHTRQVLGSLVGYNDTRLTALFNEGVLGGYDAGRLPPGP
jgi:glutaryl-CoA transferase